MAMRKKKRIVKKNTTYAAYKNTKWFKAMRLTQRLVATERMLNKYTQLKKKLEAELKRFK